MFLLCSYAQPKPLSLNIWYARTSGSFKSFMPARNASASILTACASNCRQLPGARPENVRQGIVELALLTKVDNIAILVHGVSFSPGDSGRLGSPTPMPPFSNRHHPVSRSASGAVNIAREREQLLNFQPLPLRHLDLTAL